MKSAIAVSCLLLLSMAAARADETAASSSSASTHRYMIERTFPKGALDGLTNEGKAQVNEKNASVGVRWLTSFTNSDKTKTYCVYEGPSEAAVRKAAALNKLPVDRVTEIPFDLESNSKPVTTTAAAK